MIEELSKHMFKSVVYFLKFVTIKCNFKCNEINW